MLRVMTVTTDNPHIKNKKILPLVSPVCGLAVILPTVVVGAVVTDVDVSVAVDSVVVVVSEVDVSVFSKELG